MVDGIYCLANDAVSDWAVAFLASLRLAAPKLPVVIIPYDARTDRLRGLQRIHPFELWNDLATLAMLDDVGRAINPGSSQTFRKLAAFWGPFDRFLFLDSDVIVSTGVEEPLWALDPTTPTFLCGDLDMEQVFRPSVLRDEIEASGRISGFNTGFFASTRDAISKESVLDHCAQAQAVRSWFVPGAQEQPFLNWSVWRSGISVRSIAAATPDASTYTSARRRPLRRSADGTIRVFDPASDDYGRRMLVVHWAGFRCTSRMPNRALFLRYRLGRTSVGEQAAFLARWVVGALNLFAARIRRRRGVGS